MAAYTTTPKTVTTIAPGDIGFMLRQVVEVRRGTDTVVLIYADGTSETHAVDDALEIVDP